MMRRLMMDGHREFGRNQLVLVYDFDRAARVKMLRKGYLRLQRSPEDAGLVSHVTEEELRRQLRRDERHKRRRAAGVAPHGGGSSDEGAGRDGDGGLPARKRSRRDGHAGARKPGDRGAQAGPGQHGGGGSQSRVGDRRARTLLRIVSAAAGAYDHSLALRLRGRWLSASSHRPSWAWSCVGCGRWRRPFSEAGQKLLRRPGFQSVVRIVAGGPQDEAQRHVIPHLPCFTHAPVLSCRRWALLCGHWLAPR